jgi:hypothetical protein
MELVDLLLHFVAHNSPIALNSNPFNRGQQVPQPTSKAHLVESAVLAFYRGDAGRNRAVLITRERTLSAWCFIVRSLVSQLSGRRASIT